MWIEESIFISLGCVGVYRAGGLARLRQDLSLGVRFDTVFVRRRALGFNICAEHVH